MNDEAARRRLASSKIGGRNWLLGATFCTRIPRLSTGALATPAPCGVDRAADGHRNRLTAPRALLDRARGPAGVGHLPQAASPVRGRNDASPVTRADERAGGAHRPALGPCPAYGGGRRGRREANLPALGPRFLAGRSSTHQGVHHGRNGEFTVVSSPLVGGWRPVPPAPSSRPRSVRLFPAGGVGAFVEQDGRRRPDPLPQHRPAAGLRFVVASRSHGDAAALDAFLDGLGGRAQRRLLRSLCSVAAARPIPIRASAAPWNGDIAAGSLVLALSTSVRKPCGALLAYGAGAGQPHFVARRTGLGADDDHPPRPPPPRSRCCWRLAHGTASARRCCSVAWAGGPTCSASPASGRTAGEPRAPSTP